MRTQTSESKIKNRSHGDPPPAYAELQVTTNFTFLTGGSHPHELVAQAKALGLTALAITDRNTLAGIVRAHSAAKEVGLKLIVGARLDLQDAPSLLCLPTDRAAYGRLSRLLSLGQRRAEKGKCILRLDDVTTHAEGQIFIVLPPESWDWRARQRSGAIEPQSPRQESPRQRSGVHPAAIRTEAPQSLDQGRTTPQSPRQEEPRQRSGMHPAAIRIEGPQSLDQGRTTPQSPRQEEPRQRSGMHPAAIRIEGPQSLDQGRTTSQRVPAGSPEASRNAPQKTHNFIAFPCPAPPPPPPPPPPNPADFAAQLQRITAALAPSPVYLAASHSYRGDDRARIAALEALANRCGTPLVATGDVIYHAAHRRPLADVLAAIRHGTTVAAAGTRLPPNAERHLKPPREMSRLFRGHEAAIARTLEIADACRFSLDELVYEYPDEPVPSGKTAQSHLESLTWDGAAARFPAGLPDKVAATLRRELDLIATLKYAHYFLTVHDIVAYARAQGILCQGRGSAANSAVCYCLGITAVNPTEIDLLFERFVSPERKEPPDIDVDFEHERREEVIQYIYARYGRDRAGLAATVISYRARSAVREVGKAMGLSEDTVAALAGMVWGSRADGTLPEQHIREAGLDPHDPLIVRVIELAEELIGFPRHLSQHVGGFVLTRSALTEVVPVGNAAMEDRTVIEWDKDDLDALGLLKVDVLALGMLSCIRRAFSLLETHHRLPMSLARVPREDPAVYDMLCRADSVGVFQVESRAQMNMLPRLKPRTFYDLVIEVAIVRPGPIQGDMVHPYLRRRSGLEEETYPSPDPAHGPPDELRQILGKTKGVPLFQEQAMRIAMVAARFSDADVNELRKAMATFRRAGTIGRLEDKMISAMVARGYDRNFAERCFSQIKGFGEYGFPESHAASFAHLVYVSSWLKCHYPATFACALLNAQPMGFYAPAQIVRDAREHGVEVRPVDVNHSDWDCTLEDSFPAPGGRLPAGKSPGASKVNAAVSSGRSGEHADAAAALGRSGEHADAAGGRLPEGESPAATKTPAASKTPPALRLGFRQIDGMRQEDAERLVAARHARSGRLPEGESERAIQNKPSPRSGRLPEGESERAFENLHDLWHRAGLSPPTLERLAAADAFRSLGLDRRQALWEVKALKAPDPLPLFGWADTREVGRERTISLPEMALSEHVVNDYQTLRLSLKAHPISFLRPRLHKQRVLTCADLRTMKDGAWVAVAGVVLVRQRPGSAKGVVFMTIEDETGVANAVIWPKTLERFRKVVMTARLVLIHGRIQRHEDIIHVVSTRLEDRNDWLATLSELDTAMPMPTPIANADEVLRPEPGSARSPLRRDGLPRPSRHPRQQVVIPKSRDFH